MSEEISITVKSSGDKKYAITISPEATILELKEKIATESEIPAANQRLIYSGRVLKDADQVSNYKIQSGHTIHLVRGGAGGASRPSPSTTTTASNTTGSSATPDLLPGAASAAAAPTNIASGQGGAMQNPFLALTNLQNMGYNIPMPSESMFGSDGGLTSIPDENTILDMMEQPGVQSLMNQMLSDPLMLDMMIQQSPQLRSMGPMAREMLQSDYMRQMLTNPQFIRSALAMSRSLNQNTGAASAFPAPGPATETTGAGAGAGDATASAGAANATPNATANPASAPANPFAALLGAGAGAGANPFASMLGGFPPSGANADQQGANPLFNPELMNLFFGGAGGAGAAALQDTRPPEERYESQLRQLNDMGFMDFDRNVSALRRTGGSVQGAIELLLNGDV